MCKSFILMTGIFHLHAKKFNSQQYLNIEIVQSLLFSVYKVLFLTG